ncbi:MAG: hypothetical protein ACRELE_02135 [Gemmatimonadales bacterium]
MAGPTEGQSRHATASSFRPVDEQPPSPARVTWQSEHDAGADSAEDADQRVEQGEPARRGNDDEPTRSPPRWIMGASAALVALLIAGGGWTWYASRAKASTALQRLTTEKQGVERELAQTRVLTAEKDSLMAEVVETTSLLTDISQAVTTLQGGRNALVLEESGKSFTARQARAALMPKIDSLRARLDAAEGRLGASLDRVHQMSGVESQLRGQITEYERTIASVRKLIATQQEQLNSLGTEIASLRAENKKLVETNGQLVATQGALQDSVTAAREAENTVYWVAGAKNALMQLGVVVEEGKGKFLLFGKGKSVVPSRDPKPTDFTATNKRQTSTITLPKSGMRYKILTRQNLSALQNVLDKDGHVRGTLQITDPVAFWAPSPFLILIEDK